MVIQSLAGTRKFRGSTSHSVSTCPHRHQSSSIPACLHTNSAHGSTSCIAWLFPSHRHPFKCQAVHFQDYLLQGEEGRLQWHWTSAQQRDHGYISSLLSCIHISLTYVLSLHLNPAHRGCMEMQRNPSEERGNEERQEKWDVLSWVASHEATSLYHDADTMDLLKKVAGVFSHYCCLLCFFLFKWFGNNCPYLHRHCKFFVEPLFCFPNLHWLLIWRFDICIITLVLWTVVHCVIAGYVFF